MVCTSAFVCAIVSVVVRPGIGMQETVMQALTLTEREVTSAAASDEQFPCTSCVGASCNVPPCEAPKLPARVNGQAAEAMVLSRQPLESQSAASEKHASAVHAAQFAAEEARRAEEVADARHGAAASASVVQAAEYRKQFNEVASQAKEQASAQETAHFVTQVAAHDEQDLMEAAPAQEAVIARYVVGSAAETASEFFVGGSAIYVGNAVQAKAMRVAALGDSLQSEHSGASSTDSARAFHDAVEQEASGSETYLTELQAHVKALAASEEDSRQTLQRMGHEVEAARAELNEASPRTAENFRESLKSPVKELRRQHDMLRIVRVGDGPIVHAGMDDRMLEKDATTNATEAFVSVTSPSLIRVPDWVEGALGRYYLYFAHHKGKYIRLAYADMVQGPWTVYTPGVLDLEKSHFSIERPADDGLTPIPGRDQLRPHIASPDVVVDHDRRRFVMYYHGLEGRTQRSRMAFSGDGLHFEVSPQLIAGLYLRHFQAPAVSPGHFLFGMPTGQLANFFWSADGLPEFQARESSLLVASLGRHAAGVKNPGDSGSPQLFGPDMRHAGVFVQGQVLHVFWTRVGDNPERVLWSRVQLAADWREWSVSEPEDVLYPDMPWEGSQEPSMPSQRGEILDVVRQLRDPYVFEDDDGCLYLLYTGGGEQNICLAKIQGLSSNCDDASS